MRRLILATVIALGMLACAPHAHACPMCRAANESGENAEVQDARPRAYMYSILFMLSMPATLLGGFSIGFYRLHRRQQLTRADWPDSDPI